MDKASTPKKSAICCIVSIIRIVNTFVHNVSKYFVDYVHNYVYS